MGSSDRLVINEKDRIQDFGDPGKKHLGNAPCYRSDLLNGRVVHGVCHCDIDLFVVAIECYDHILMAKIRSQNADHVGINRVIFKRDIRNPELPA